MVEKWGMDYSGWDRVLVAYVDFVLTSSSSRN